MELNQTNPISDNLECRVEFCEIIFFIHRRNEVLGLIYIVRKWLKYIWVKTKAVQYAKVFVLSGPITFAFIFTFS